MHIFLASSQTRGICAIFEKFFKRGPVGEEIAGWFSLLHFFTFECRRRKGKSRRGNLSPFLCTA